jgi:hypothetical protein
MSTGTFQFAVLFEALAIWTLLSVPFAILVGKFFHFGESS